MCTYDGITECFLWGIYVAYSELYISLSLFRLLLPKYI